MADQSFDGVYLNGEVVRAADARVSVFDRGFLFGDGVYEVVRCFDGRWLDMDLHVGRLCKSLAAVEIDPTFAEALPRAARALVGRHSIDASIYMQVTRGAAATRVHIPPPGLVPTVMATLSPTEPLKTLRELAIPASIDAVTRADSRWLRLEIKSISLMGALLPLLDAHGQGAGEVIFTRDGMLAEGGSSNVFLVIDGALVTPPLGDPPMLHGCLRTRLLAVAIERGIPTTVRRVRAEELGEASAILTTGSRSLIRTVRTLDGVVVEDATGSGRAIAGELWTGLLDAIDRDARPLP